MYPCHVALHFLQVYWELCVLGKIYKKRKKNNLKTNYKSLVRYDDETCLKMNLRTLVLLKFTLECTSTDNT